MELDFLWLKLKAILRGMRRPPEEELRRLILRRRASHRSTTFIGITGSGGKTTCTYFLHHLLGQKGRSAISVIENGDIMISKRIRRLRRGFDFFVAEVSGDRPGAIARACAYLQPTVGIVTVVATDHRSNFSDISEIALEKRSLVEIVPEEGVVFLNADDPAVLGMGSAARGSVVTYGRSETSDYRASDVSVLPSGRLSFLCHHRGESCRFEVNFTGEHFITLVLGAIACAHHLGLPLQQIAERSVLFPQLPGRCSQHRSGKSPLFICDTVKAPLKTIDLAINLVSAFKEVPRKTIVIGTISEKGNGSDSKAYKRPVQLSKEMADRVILFGPRACSAKVSKEDLESGWVHRVSTIVELRDLIRETGLEGELILLKGGQKTDHLERIAIDYERPVTCWEDRCGRNISCFTCSKCHR